jgi:hypothetical protein
MSDGEEMMQDYSEEESGSDYLQEGSEEIDEESEKELNLGR